MKKDLEDYLWNNFGLCKQRQTPFAREIIEDMVKSGMIKNPKQAHRTLEKWLVKHKYDYGCCLDLGWKENETLDT